MESKGFVSQHVRVEQQQNAGTTDSPSEYKRVTAAAERLSVDYRFKPGSSTLDNKAVADLDRLSTFLSDLYYSGVDLILLGSPTRPGARMPISSSRRSGRMRWRRRWSGGA